MSTVQAVRLTTIPPCPLCGQTGCDRLTPEHQRETIEDHLRAKYRVAESERMRYRAFLEVIVQEMNRAIEFEGIDKAATARIATGIAEAALNTDA